MDPHTFRNLLQVVLSVSEEKMNFLINLRTAKIMLRLSGINNCEFKTLITPNYSIRDIIFEY